MKLGLNMKRLTILLTLVTISLTLGLSACVVPEEMDETDTPASTLPAEESPLSSVVISPLPTPTEDEDLITEPRGPKESSEKEEEEREMSQEAQAAVDKALEALAKRMKVTSDQDQIEVVSVEHRNFRDSSLGCPKKGMMYLQVITPGYQIILELEGKTYDYRVAREQVVLCQGKP